MRQIASFQSPRRIYYGSGALEKVGGSAIKLGKKALIVTDEMMDRLGYVAQCKDYLRAHQVEFSTYMGIRSEPTDKYVEEALAQRKEEQCDVIVSLGGGSCIDTAKAVAVLAANPGDIGEFMGERRIAEQKPVPHIAIPTTAGTGSEVTDVTVITATKTDVKMMIKQPAFMPEIAIIDPLLTMSSPKGVTAATGVDALSHAIEAFISRKSHPMADMFALSAMRNIIPNIKPSYDDGNNVGARELMSLGSMQAGFAFSNASVCLVHGMSRPIGALFHIPHGISNAMLLPAVLEFSKEHCIDKLAMIGKMFAPEAQNLAEREYAELAVRHVKALAASLNIPNLRTWGVEEKKFQQYLSKMARDALDSGSPGNNPRVPTAEEIVALYNVCYDYRFSE